MANEEVLRLRTTVVSDEALAQIRAIGREIGLVPAKAKPAVQSINKDFATLSTTVKKLGGEILTVVPALGSLGIGAAGAGAAVAVLINTMRSAAKGVVELKFASKELGMSERDIRAWSNTAEKAGVTAQSMISGMEAFKKTTDGLKYNIGGARDELYAMGAGPIVQRMQAAVTQAEKMKVAFKFKDELMKDDPSGFKARMFFDQIGFGADKARLSYEQFERAQARIKPVTAEDQERAQKFADSLVDLGEAWDHLIVKTGVEIFPGLTKAIDGLSTLLDKIEAIDSAWDKWARGPSGKGTVLGKIIPGYDEQPNLNPRSGYRPPAAATDGAQSGGSWSDWFGSNRSSRLGHGPGRRAGGPVFGGLSYTVGENGPETFVPGMSGRISAGGGRDEGVKVVKEGVFAALIDFKSYVESGATAGGGVMPVPGIGGGAGGGMAGAGGGGGGGMGAAPGGASPGFGGGGGGGGFNAGAPNGQAPSGGTGGGGGTSENLTPGSGGGTAGAPPASAAPAGSGGEVGPAAALAFARQHLGEHEIRDQGKLQKFFSDNGVKVNPRTTAWCAGFINASLNAAGIKGTGSLAAGSFAKYGTKVEAGDIKAGDIGVVGGISPRTGMQGSHVGFLTGETRMGPRGLEAQMLSGNESDQVKTAWRPISQLNMRRPPAPEGGAVAAAPSGQAAAAAPEGSTAPGGGRVTRFSESVNAAITSGAAQGGVSARMMGAIASIESSGKPGAQTGSYKGLFQLSESEFRKYGGQGSIFDAKENARVAALKLKSEQAQLSAKLGRPVSEAEVYMAHQQGVGGATQHITHPDQPAWMSMYNTAEGRQKGVGWAKKAIWGNVPDQYKKKFGSVDNITSGQFTGMWADRYARATGTDRIDKAVDTAAAGGAKAEGNVRVKIESNGTAAKAKAETDGGLWQKSTIENYRQMQPTSKPAKTVDEPVNV